MTLRIFLDDIILWAPSILYLKGLVMRNLQYEMRICQKSHKDSLCMFRIVMDHTLLIGTGYFEYEFNSVN